MSTSSQRGRKVQRQKTSSTPLLIAIGVVVAVGIVFAAFTLFGGGNSEVPQVSGVEKVTINAPTGKTEEGFWYKGDPNAPVKVIEYADYQCPGCAAFAQTLGKQITTEYIETGKIQLIFHDFPLPQHARARPAATAARCAGDQGDYWSMHDTLFKRQNEWAENRRAVNLFAGYAQALGMDTAKFQQCVSGDTYASQLEAAVQSGTAAQVPATPSFSINGKIIPGDQLLNEIQTALTAAGQ